MKAFFFQVMLFDSIVNEITLLHNTSQVLYDLLKTNHGSRALISLKS